MCLALPIYGFAALTLPHASNSGCFGFSPSSPTASPNTQCGLTWNTFSFSFLFSHLYIIYIVRNWIESKTSWKWWKKMNQVFLLCHLNIIKMICESCLVVSNYLPPRGLYSPWSSPGQNSGVGSCFLPQGIFPGLPHCRRILYQLSHQGKYIIIHWREFGGRGKCYKLLYFKIVLNHIKYESKLAYILLNRIVAMPSLFFFLSLDSTADKKIFYLGKVSKT